MFLFAIIRTMKPTSDIQSIRRRAVPILRRYGVSKAAVFGSFARGDQRKKSDIDLLIRARPTMSLLELIGLQYDLEDQLGRSVDVVTYRALHPRIRDRVLREQVLIYEKRT